MEQEILAKIKREGPSISIKVSVNKEDIILCVNAPNNSFKIHEAKNLTEVKGEMDKTTIAVTDINTSLRGIG